jgi:hypothetical protein
MQTSFTSFPLKLFLLDEASIILLAVTFFTITKKNMLYNNKENVVTVPLVTATLMQNWLNKFGSDSSSNNTNEQASNDDAADILSLLQMDTQEEQQQQQQPPPPPPQYQDDCLMGMIQLLLADKQKNISLFVKRIIHNTNGISLMDEQVTCELLDRRDRLLAMLQIFMFCELKGRPVWYYIPSADKKQVLNTFFCNELLIEIRESIEKGTLFGKFFTSVLTQEDLFSDPDSIFALLSVLSDNYSASITIIATIVLSFQASHQLICNVVESTLDNVKQMIKQSGIHQYFTYMVSSSSSSSIVKHVCPLFDEIEKLGGEKMIDMLQSEVSRFHSLLSEGGLDFKTSRVCLKGLFIMADNLLFYRVESESIYQMYDELATVLSNSNASLNVIVNNDRMFLRKKHN